MSDGATMMTGFKNVNIVITIPDGDYCQGGPRVEGVEAGQMPICQFFDNNCGMRTCALDMGVQLADMYGTHKANACKALDAV